MKSELSYYAVRFSHYEGGATISMYLASVAELRGIEFFRFHALVPSYSFAAGVVTVRQASMDEDFKAWYDLMRRLDHLFNLHVDLSELDKVKRELAAEWDAKIDHLTRTTPRLGVRNYLEKVNADFSAESFDALSDTWIDALRDAIEGDDRQSVNSVALGQETGSPSTTCTQH